MLDLDSEGFPIRHGSAISMRNHPDDKKDRRVNTVHRVSKNRKGEITKVSIYPDWSWEGPMVFDVKDYDIREHPRKAKNRKPVFQP